MTAVHRCQFKGCENMGASVVRMGTDRDYLYACALHAARFHVMTHPEITALYREGTQARRSFHVASWSPHAREHAPL